jgi:hypothetical protein
MAAFKKQGVYWIDYTLTEKETPCLSSPNA